MRAYLRFKTDKDLLDVDSTMTNKEMLNLNND